MKASRLNKLELLGHVGVDSGTIVINDPIHSDTINFEEIFSCVDNGDSELPYENGNAGRAIVVPTGIGDGYYPVYAKIADEGFGERIYAIVIDFSRVGKYVS
jgi:hypothetical protein